MTGITVAPTRPGPRVPATGILLVVLVLGAAVAAIGISQPTSDTSTRLPVRALAPDHLARARTYSQSPVSFEQNAGQVTRSVRFFARGEGYALGLTLSGPELVLQSAAGSHGKASASRREAVLSSTFVGGAPRPRLVASRQQAARVNYLLGSDPSRWRTGVRTYGQVTYRDVWPGIAVAFHGNQQSLEYDYRLAPGADPSRIKVRFRGASSVRIDPRGDLVLRVGGRTVRELAPRAYQLAGGERRVVRSRFVIGPGGTVGVRVGRYDRSRALVIDPVLAYATYLGGNAFDDGQGIAVDSGGDAYVTGQTASTDFPTSAGAEQDGSGGDGDAFVTKLTPTGAIAFSTYLGGAGPDSGQAIALDNSGNAYITGGTSSTDFPTTAGAAQSTNAGGAVDGFVTKLTASGAVAYSTYLGGSGFDEGDGIAVSASGTIYIAGQTNSADFPVTPGAAQSTNHGGYDAFATTLTATGEIASSTYLGGSSDDEALGISLDSAGNAYVTGFTNSSNFLTSTGALQTAKHGTRNAFVTKLTASGTIGYSTYWGATDTEGDAIAVNGAGAAYIAGTTNDGDASELNYDAYELQLTPTGALVSYGTFGGAGDDGATGIALDAAGDAFISGGTSSTNFPTTASAIQTTNHGGDDDAFMTEITPSGTTGAIRYSTYLGGSGHDGAIQIGLDHAGNVYLTGDSNSGNFPVTTGAAQSSNHGSEDAFVARIDMQRGTTTALACAPNPVTIHVASTCTATITDTDPGTKQTPSGTVTFTHAGSGSYSASSCTLTASGTLGKASCSVTYTPSATGTATLRASYPGDSAHLPSTITTKLPVQTQPRTTATTIACAPASLPINAPATCTATVTDSDQGTPSTPAGTITFTRSGPGTLPGDKATGTCTLAATGTAGVSSCQTTYTPSGTATSTIRATYSGEPGHATSTLTTKLTATTRTTSTVVTCAPNPLPANTTATCAATITDTATGTKLTPTGTIAYTRAGAGAFPGDKATGTCTLTPTGTTGQASCTIAFTPSAAGTDTIRATYTPDSTHATSTQTTKLTVAAS